MSNGNNLVITVYGHGDDAIDKIAVSVFDDGYSGRYYRDADNSFTYCYMINSMELKDDKWINAKAIPTNTPFPLKDLLPINFQNLILSIDDRSLQKVFRETDKRELAKAFINCTEEVKEKLYKNISSTAKQMLLEDMEEIYVKQASNKDIINCQKNIITIIRHFEDTGEIIVNRFEK